MQKLQELMKINEADKQRLKKVYIEALKDNSFNELVNTINLNESILCKYTSRLKDSAIEFQNCINCKGLPMCKNELPGYINMPVANEDKVTFVYSPCKYQEKELENSSHYKHLSLFDVPSSLKNAKLKEIFLDDKSRIEVIKYINNYIENYSTNRRKGLFLYGNFGSGKTYIIASLFNELAKQNINSAIIYFPEFLRTLKSSFTPSENGEASFSDKFEYIKKVPLLLIDDIGAENVTPWSRDEVLGTILQYRMEENLATFFTSNLSLEELDSHLSIGTNRVDQVKARRIIERIKFLTEEMKLIGVDRRK